MTLDIDWTQQPLGQMADARLAKQLGCGWRTVIRARQRLGIPAFQPHSKRRKEDNWKKRPNIRGTIDWDSQPLGKVTDRTIAKKLRCSVPSVVYARRVRGVPAFRPISKRRDFEIDRSRLGTATDGDLAREWGCHFSTVRSLRVQLGIPAFVERDLGKRGQIARVLVGVLPDRDVATITGLSEDRTAEIRKELGLRPPHHKRFCPCGQSTNQGGRFCSERCSDQVYGARALCKLSKKTRHNHYLDEVLWHFANLSRSISRLEGSGSLPRIPREKDQKGKARPNRTPCSHSRSRRACA